MNLGSQTLDASSQPNRNDLSMEAFKDLYNLQQNFAPSPFTSSEKSSPSLSPQHKYFDACQLDAELLGEKDMIDKSARVGFHAKMNEQHDYRAGSAISSKSKSTSAERRAAHNAIERARRESLNARFLELARALPTMANVKRPSKNAIVIKSLEWICESQARENNLMRENAMLRAQINQLQTQPLANGITGYSSYQLDQPAGPLINNAFHDSSQGSQFNPKSYEQSRKTSQFLI